MGFRFWECGGGGMTSFVIYSKGCVIVSVILRIWLSCCSIRNPRSW